MTRDDFTEFQPGAALAHVQALEHSQEQSAKELVVERRPRHLRSLTSLLCLDFSIVVYSLFLSQGPTFPKEKMHENIILTFFTAKFVWNVYMLLFYRDSIKHIPHAVINDKNPTRYLKDRSLPGSRLGITSIIRTLSNGVQSLRGALGFGKPGFVSDTELPLHERQSHRNAVDAGDHELQDPVVSPPELLYLLLCYSEGQYATRLLQLDLATVMCDKILFGIIRQNYYEMRGKWHQYLSLRTLESIKFVHFEMYRSGLVDVRKTDDVPPPTHLGYRYEPAPPDIMPPVGDGLMVHCEY